MEEAGRPGLVTASQVATLQKLLKGASGGQSGTLITQSACNFAAHGPTGLPTPCKNRYMPVPEFNLAYSQALQGRGGGLFKLRPKLPAVIVH